MNQPQVKKSQSILADAELENMTFYCQINNGRASLSFDGNSNHSFWISLEELQKIKEAIEAAQKEAGQE